MTTRSPKRAPAASAEPVDEADKGTAAALRKHGIVATQHTSYEWNGYRYTNSHDAIAAATRAKR